MAHTTPHDMDKIRQRARRIAGQKGVPTEAPRRPLSMVPMPRGGSRAGVWQGSGMRIGWVIPLGLVLILVLLFNEQLGLQTTLGLSTSGYMTESSTGAVDGLAWAEMVWAEKFDDEARLTKLRNAGSIFTLQKGAPVEVVGFALGSRKVRPLNGAGRSGWVPARAVATR